MSTLRNFLAYSASQGWVDDSVLVACFTVADSEPRREWLHPEQVVGLDALVQSSAFDEYQRFAWYVLLCTGVRSAELVKLQPRDLDRRERVLNVVGKGRGEGKKREIEVDDEFITRWQDHIDQHGLRPTDYMFFHRHMRFCGGVHKDMEWVEDRARPATAKPIRKFFEKLRKAAEAETKKGGLDPDLLPSFDLTPKVMRRTFACLALIADALSDEDGLDIRSLQKAMGHSSLEITALYLADVDRYLRRKRRRFNAMRAVELAVAREAD